MQADRQTIELSVKGICGVSLANNVMAFIDLKSELPDIDDCLANPETCRLPDDSNISVIFAFNSVLARKASATNIHRVIAIADRLPKIYGAKLVYDAIAYCPDAADTSAYLSWSGRNRTTFIDS